MNCKNCGAPIYGSKCEYCGSLTDSQDAANLYADDKIIASVPIGSGINKEMLDDIKAAMIAGGGSVLIPAEVRLIVKGGKNETK